MTYCLLTVNNSKMLFLLLLSFFWSLVEVLSQTEYPYVSFMGENLPNHSYVDLTLVGNDNSDPGNTVRCITDLGTCCRAIQGIHRGYWYFPDGRELDQTTRTRTAQRVNLYRRNNAMGPSGIYHCDIPTVTVHDDNDLSVRETVYVGLYASGGNELINSVYILSYILWGQLFRLDKQTVRICNPSCMSNIVLLHIKTILIYLGGHKSAS